MIVSGHRASSSELLLAYVAATVGAAGAALLQWGLRPILGDTAQYILFLAPVMLAAWLGGRRPALLATATGALLGNVLFVEPHGGWPVLGHPDDIVRLIVFLALGLGISFLAGRMHSQRLIAERQAHELYQSEQRFRGTFENAAVGIAHIDREGRFIRVNQKLREILGYWCDELRGRRFEELTHPEDRERDASKYAALMRGELDSYAMEERYVRKDGSLIWVAVTRSVQRAEDGSPAWSISVIQDITERKRAEAALREREAQLAQANEAAEAANRAKDQFLAVLSHELRTPLTPVLATACLLLEERQLREDLRQSIEVICRNAQLEARLIDDLLDVTRIAKGKIELDRRPVAICTILQRAAEVCQPDVEARGLHFGMDIRNPPHLVNVDASRMQQVFWNLLKNAVKFTPPGGCVGVRCWREDDGVVTEINDSGVGIEPDALPHIFKPFEQGGMGTTRQFGGLGLGLTICKALVELHGGTIEVQSEGKNKGASFRVRLPVLRVAAISPGMGRPAPQDAGPAVTHRPLRILLVEDHGDTARVMRRLLMMDGHTVETAGDVATALELASSHAFDLLISDLGLPDGNGTDLMRELRVRGQTMPGIALSGYGQEQDIQRSREAGFAAHLTKPTSSGRLAEAIAAVSGHGTGRPLEYTERPPER